MSRRPFPFAELILFSGILASGYVIVAAAKATATPVAASDRHDKQPTASEAANPAPTPAPTLAPRTRFSPAKPPVPLRTSRHATYWVEDPERPTTTTMEGAVTEPTNKRVTSDATAKAMIEADGYKNVRSLVQAPDGAWRGLAMRGAAEIAISVDAKGRVLAE
jgi:hypothetical protein